MKNNIRILMATCLAAIIIIVSCKKPEYSFGKIVTPTDVALTTDIEGVDATNPNGSGSGNVAITIKAANAVSYKVDYGDGNTEMVPSGQVTHKYSNPGTADYNIIVSAIGTGGVTSTLTKKITVFVDFKIPAEILQDLTNGSSQTWVTARETPGHVGVGPADSFGPDYYAAEPNQRSECLYDDEMTFSKDENDKVTLTINNKGQSFSTAGGTATYGVSGPDDCYNIDVSAPRKLTFMNATSNSTAQNSTRIQFVVPGNGLINFGTGGNTYEILSITPTTITLRNIGADGLAWYQKFKVKQ
ncbi:PKD domain-containing protein [Mucilaginibacter litoreus]|uniref:PKD domain-containing protein n=1 Tax=Mucilaginibacter litoreus TaxID=1048221 RepID=A0ABW3AVL6_9SPHI